MDKETSAEIEWDTEEIKKAFLDSAKEYDRLVKGEHELPHKES
tara:strand:- start:167 stop:295 length:129 start_codon:yes stop_codon:yes gene_type:complete